MPVEIRRLRTEDAPIAGALMLEYKIHTYRRFLPADRLEQVTLEQCTKICKHLLKNRKANAIFVAFVDGEPAAIGGVSRLRWKKNVPPGYGGEIHTFYVKRAFRPRHKLADRLWSHMVDWLERAGIVKAVAFVLETNRSANPARFSMRGSKIIGTKPADGLWEGYNFLIHGWDELRRAIPSELMPELKEEDEEKQALGNKLLGRLTSLFRPRQLRN